MRTFTASGSKNIASVGYDPVKQLLRVVFVGGTSWYEYRDVPKSVAAELFVCDSLGGTFAELVKKPVQAGVYTCTKIEDPRSTPDGRAYWDEVFGAQKEKSK